MEMIFNTKDTDIHRLVFRYDYGDEENMWCRDTDADIDIYTILEQALEQSNEEPNDTETYCVRYEVIAYDKDDNEIKAAHTWVDFAVHPCEPDICWQGEWYAPLSIVGGTVDAPGVSRGTNCTVQLEVCDVSGIYRKTSTADAGKQIDGLTEEWVEFLPPDEKSLAWVFDRAIDVAQDKISEHSTVIEGKEYVLSIENLKDKIAFHATSTAGFRHSVYIDKDMISIDEFGDTEYAMAETLIARGTDMLYEEIEARTS